jgi:SpoVK/Ycf46/Vps4 family AAA+-type ATPase
MEPSDLPAAILRSGRVELWLETRLPDESARAEIFRTRLASLPRPLCDADVRVLASASRGSTGADLKAIIEDGKLQFAYDRSRESSACRLRNTFSTQLGRLVRIAESIVNGGARNPAKWRFSVLGGSGG